jgi:hypothetical protein
VVWEKIRPSGDTVAAEPLTPAPTASASAAASTPTPKPAAGVAVPADWTSFTDAAQKATFSHPGAWKDRRDGTGIFFGEVAATSPSGFGPRMVGLATVPGADAAAALAKVQSSEFAAQSGLTVDHSGPTTDANTGTQVQELAGSYTREGQQVSYVMRTVAGQGVVYVLIARVPVATAATELAPLAGALRTSLRPAA